VRLFNTPPQDQHYWAWFLDINGEFPDNRNLIAGDPKNIGGCSDIYHLSNWASLNLTKPDCEVRIAPTYKHMFKPYFI